MIRCDICESDEPLYWGSPIRYICGECRHIGGPRQLSPEVGLAIRELRKAMKAQSDP